MPEQLSPLPPSPDRILVRGVNWLGDAVMSTPALQRLRERFPETTIALLTHEKLAELWEHHPSVNEVIPFASGESAWSVGRRLRGADFQTAVVLPNSPRSALEVWLARIPQRVGYGRAWRKWFLTQLVPPRPGDIRMHKRSESEIKRLISLASKHTRTAGSSSPSRAHQIYNYLHLVAALGANNLPVAPNLHVTQSELERTARKFGLACGPRENQERPLFGLNAGAEYGPAKRWPSERFIAAAIDLQRRTDCQWLLFGGKSDIGLAEKIAQGIRRAKRETSKGLEQVPALNLAGETSLRELMALLKLCRVLLTNDTGPMHIAAALGTPVAVPFGSTSPELSGPGLPGDTRHQLLRSDAPCSPCFRRTCPIDFRCMTGISVESMVQAVLRAASSP